MAFEARAAGLIREARPERGDRRPAQERHVQHDGQHGGHDADHAAPQCVRHGQLVAAVVPETQ